MNPRLGHLVLNVSRLKTSERFYRRVLGMKKRRAGTVNGNAMVFLTFGANDHDLALLEVGPATRLRGNTGTGLRHVAFRIGDRLKDLRGFKKRLDRLGISALRTAQHRVSQSIYLQDPDGIEIEVYVDSSTPVWQSRRKVRVMNTALKIA